MSGDRDHEMQALQEEGKVQGAGRERWPPRSAEKQCSACRNCVGQISKHNWEPVLVTMKKDFLTLRAVQVDFLILLVNRSI